MPTLQELFDKYNIDTAATPQSGARSKLMIQANRMLNELKSYKTEQELDGTSSQYWWAPQSVEGQRRISMRYGGKVVPNTAAYVDNTLKAVTDHIETLKKIIEESNEATWADEEERRAKKS
jgi:DNA polymerase II small subunit/DNA polymerase delta subunit B